MLKRRQFLQTLSAVAALSGGQSSSLEAISDPLSMPSSPGVGHTEDGGRDFFYRPQHGWTGDCMPFYKDGKFRIFFEPSWRDAAHCPAGEPLYWPGSWYQISTEDFVHFTEHGKSLAVGSRDEQDLGCFSGSVIEADGQYHIFYAGNNRYFPKQGKPANGVMHAVSRDLLNWTKIPNDVLYASPAIYDANDWRDPFVFWNEEAREYWMLVAAQLKSGPPRRRGCTALCTSPDLKNWEVREPFWAPGLYIDHECPDLFRMGDWWYLVFSEYSEQHRTHYRMSHTLKGPWLVPNNDSFDARAFYAAKTASDGQRRYAFGWNPTRYDKVDYLRWNLDADFMPCKPYPSELMIGPSGWDWGGNLVVHELFQESDGSLSARVPAAVNAAFSNDLPCQFQSGGGLVEVLEKSVQIHAPDEFACSVAGIMPLRCKIETTIVFEGNTHGCGLMLRVSDDLDSAYYVRLEPLRNRLVFDTWPRSGDTPFEVGLERPLLLSPGTQVAVKVFVDDSVCVVYADNKVAMNARLYDLKHGSWGVFVKEGSARFQNLRISTL
jgi:beta-fructofuranosidase